MSLVAYDSSDESEEEISSKRGFSSIDTKDNPIITIKKQRESAKITIPSLKEFEEEEIVEVPKKKPKFQSEPGLFSPLLKILPPPKSATTLSKPGFVPYVLKSKKEPTSSSAKPAISTPKLQKSNISLASVSSDQDCDDDISHVTPESSNASSVDKDFFSLEDSIKDKLPVSNYILTDYSSVDITSESSKDKLITENQSHELPLKHRMVVNELDGAPYPVYEQIPLTDAAQIATGHSSKYYTDSISEPEGQESLLRDKEFLKLQGRRREFENVDFIDVNAADQLTDKNEWLLKSLTEESTYRPSRKKHNMPTQQQKRKHQITYLAFQAKEREMDLKNQWSLNSRTRRETQAKYGF